MSLKEFNNLLAPLRIKLFRFAISIMQNESTAEDVVQDVYLKLWQKKELLHNYSSLEGLAMTMTKNLCLNKLTEVATHTKYLKQFGHNSSSFSLPILRNIEAKNAKNILIKLSAELPEQQRIIIHLRDFESYSFEEIEAITGFDKNYIRVNLSRARKKLKVAFQKIESYDRTRD